MDQRRKLASLIKKLSYREGSFTLASGAQSNFYIDLKATTLHPEGAALIGEVMVDEILKSNGALTLGGVGGLTLGADPIATAVSLAAGRRNLFWPAYIVRKEPKAHGTGRFLEGSENLSPGARLVVLEDVVTTGGSSQFAIEKLKDSGFNPVLVAAVVDREQGGRERYKEAGIEFLALCTLKDIRESL